MKVARDRSAPGAVNRYTSVATRSDPLLRDIYFLHIRSRRVESGALMRSPASVDVYRATVIFFLLPFPL